MMPWGGMSRLAFGKQARSELIRWWHEFQPISERADEAVSRSAELGDLRARCRRR
jgi:hypothetical protein